MNKKQLILAIVAALVVGGGALVVLKNRQATYVDSARDLGGKLLGDFDINTVAAMRITSGSNAVNVAKAGETWAVRERAEYPANFNTLAEFLRKLADMKITKPVQVGPSRLPMLELVPPDKGGKGTLVEMKDSSGKTVKSLLLGAKHMKETTGGPMGDSSYPDGRYLMVDGKQESIALVSDALTQAEPKAEDWINKDWFKVEKLKSVSVVTTNATNNWKLSRETESGEWKLADLKPGEQYDTGKGSSVTSALGWPSFNDVTNAAADATGVDKPVVTGTLETFDGYTYTAKVGKKAGGEDSYYFQIAVTGTFPKERTPGKDEKPEDKEKLDKEFKEKNQKLADKLKTEQAFGKWTYVVSKWTIDPLLKERKDLLAEKKEEPKPDEPKLVAPAPAPIPPKPPEVKPVPPPTPPSAVKPPESKPAEPAPAPPKTPEVKPTPPPPPAPPAPPPAVKAPEPKSTNAPPVDTKPAVEVKKEEPKKDAPKPPEPK